MALIFFYLLLNVAPAQERTDLSPEQMEWIQEVVNNLGRNIVYTRGVYVLPVLHTADVAVAHQFARDHDSDLRTLAPEGVRIGPVDPAHSRIWFRPGIEPFHVYDHDMPIYQPWTVPEDPRALQQLIQVQEGIEATAGDERAALERLRETIVRKCATELAGTTESAERM